MFCEYCGEPVGRRNSHLHPAGGDQAAMAGSPPCQSCRLTPSHICVLGLGHFSYLCPNGHRWSNISAE